MRKEEIERRIAQLYEENYSHLGALQRTERMYPPDGGGHGYRWRERMRRIDAEISELRAELEGHHELIRRKEALEQDQSLIPTPHIGVYEAIADIKRLSPELILHLKSSVKNLCHVDPDVFEHLVAEFFVAHGIFTDAALVGRDPATSADIFAMSSIGNSGIPARVFVEVRRTLVPQGVNAIDQVLGAMFGEQKHGWTAGMIVSLGGFTDMKKYSPGDLELRNLALRDRADLLKWLADYELTSTGLYLPKPRRRMDDA